MKIDAVRQPHAVLDLISRRKKGLKIERLLSLRSMRQPIRLLDVGTGSGGIAHYFGTHPDLCCEVTAVDVIDQRQVRDGYCFVKITGVDLPFRDESFDVVLSNHVIEHVGDRSAQLRHLLELRRVLATDGVGYLAVPNRWMIIEPHYRLPFLSWLPRPLRTPYLRLMRRGKRYDCEPLSLRELDALLEESGLSWEHIEIDALRILVEIERPTDRLLHQISKVNDKVLRQFQAVIPTLICRLYRRQVAAKHQPARKSYAQQQ